MKHFSKHLLALIILAATFSSCNVESIIDNNFKEKSLVVLAPDFINNRVSVVFKDEDTQELIQDGLEVLVFSNKKIIDLSGKYTNKFNVKGGLLQFALDPNEVLSDANPWEMKLFARDTKGESFPNMAVKKVLKPGSNIWQLSLKKVDITQPKSQAKLSPESFDNDYFLTFNGKKSDEFRNKGNVFFQKDRVLLTSVYESISKISTLDEDLTLQWGFFDEVNRVLFKLNSLDIFYKINDKHYLLTGDFENGMKVYDIEYQDLEKIDQFNYNSKSAIKLPKGAYDILIGITGELVNKYGLEVCSEGYNFNFNGEYGVVLEYKTLRKGPNDDDYISSLGYANLTENTTVNTGNHYQSNISNKVVFKQHNQYIIEPQEMDLGTNACGGEYNFKVYPRVGHERYKLNLQFQCSGEDFSKAPSLTAFMKEEGSTSDSSLIQFDNGSTSLVLKPDAKYSVEGSFNETSFGFTFTTSEDQIAQAVAATIQGNSSIENIEYNEDNINQDTVINAKVIFKSGSCPE